MFSRGKEKQNSPPFSCLTQINYTSSTSLRDSHAEPQFYLHSLVAPSSRQMNICSAWLKLFTEILLPERKHTLISPEQCVIALNFLFSCSWLPPFPLTCSKKSSASSFAYSSPRRGSPVAPHRVELREGGLCAEPPSRPR